MPDYSEFVCGACGSRLVDRMGVLTCNDLNRNHAPLCPGFSPWVETIPVEDVRIHVPSSTTSADALSEKEAPFAGWVADNETDA